MEKKNQTVNQKSSNKLARWVRKHKIAATASCVVVVCLIVYGVGFGIQAKKYANTQRALELVASGEISQEDLDALERDGGFTEFGTEIIDPTTGETVLLTQDSNGNIVRTVVTDSQGNNTGAVIPEDHSGEHQGSGDNPSPTPTPAHQHVWVAHTATRQVAQTNYVHHDAVTQQICVSPAGYCCNTCGIIMQDANAISEHVHSTGHGGRHSVPAQYETQVVQPAWDEPVTTYVTETYVDYYYCSDCGERQ